MGKVFFYVRNSRVTNPKVIRAVFNSEELEGVLPEIGIVGLKDGRYSMEVTKEGRRSNEQNGYFHGVVLPIVFKGLQDMGHEGVKDTDDAKLVLKSLFLKEKVINTETGEVITEFIKDTSKLTTFEFYTFMEQVTQWAAEYLDKVIPAPGKQITIEDDFTYRRYPDSDK